MREIGTVSKIKIGIAKDKSEITNFGVEFYMERGSPVATVRDDNGLFVIDSNVCGRGRLMCRISFLEDGCPILIKRYTGLSYGEDFIGDEGCNDGYDVVFYFGDIFTYYGVVRDEIDSFLGVSEETVKGLTSVELKDELVTEIQVTAGDKIVCLVPEGYTAKKDNGFGVGVPFSTSVMGVNGDKGVYVDGRLLRVYGELMIVNGCVKVYIDKV